MAEIPIRCRAVSAVVLRETVRGAEVLMMRRAGRLAGTWCQVAGGIEEGETAWQAALREIGEETGLVPGALYSADWCERFYEPDADVVSLLPVFVAYVDPASDVRLNDEHDAHNWLSLAEAAGRVTFPGQRAMLAHVEAEFVRRAPEPRLRIV
ncbi:MAG: NUDIX pyrophosphatase [Paracoccaceae bacterium]